jgi:hypothetical protein
MQIDVFCRVVDNYGDIGVCWRLARQWVAEHGCKLRLIVDDLRAFRFVAPEIDVSAARQSLLGVEVVAWHAAEGLTPSEVVIEAFACDPPAPYVDAMSRQAPKPVWINLEYLSAEAWVDEIHGMPSQHQRLPLTKYFFCPGFTQASGGLIRERQSLRPANLPFGPLSPGERALVRDVALDPSWAGVRGPSPLAPPPRGEGDTHATLRIFAFTYPHAPLRALTQAFTAAGVPTTVTLAAPITPPAPNWPIAAPVAQTEFDALLATFDVLIVRGEDSFIRAQWAAKPLLWHIYPTEDGAHLVKLDAWLDRYCTGLEANASGAYRAASRGFNSAVDAASRHAAFAALALHMGALAEHAVGWRDALMTQTDLATRLITFVKSRQAQNLG